MAASGVGHSHMFSYRLLFTLLSGFLDPGDRQQSWSQTVVLKQHSEVILGWMGSHPGSHGSWLFGQSLLSLVGEITKATALLLDT